MSDLRLPECWAICELDDLGIIQTGNTPPKKNPEYYGGTFPMFKPSDLDGFADVTVATEYLSDLGKEKARLIPAQSTYVTCIGATIGKTAFVSVEGTCNQQINTVTPTAGIFPKWLYYSMISPDVNLKIKENSSSTTLPILNKSKFSKLKLLLQPTAEQIVIADKLDTLLAQVENTKARLERIPQILKRFRQSVLAAAVNGDLTSGCKGLRDSAPPLPTLGNEKFSPELFEITQRSLPTLPHSWKVVPAANILSYVTSGSRGWSKYYSDSGALFLRMTNVRYDTTKLDLDDLQYVSLPESVEGKRSRIRKGDLVVSITADVGRVAHINQNLGEAYVNQHLALVRPTKEVNPEYLAICIASRNLGLKQVDELKRGATKAGLGLDDIRSLAIPFPSLDEQTEIVRRVAQIFTYTDTIEKQVTNALTRVKHLTQSILAKAFRGELTEQWRKDNPDLISGNNSAEALLTKIKAERGAVKKQPKPKRTAVKKSRVAA